MSNVLELRNGAVKRIIFYEVSDAQNIAIWGGESPSDSKIWVSEWFSDDEDAREVSPQIEITSIVLSTIANCMERWSK